MIGFAGGVKETEKASPNNPAAICKSFSDNVLRLGDTTRCPVAIGTGSALGHPLFLRAMFSVKPLEFSDQLFSAESQAVAP